MVIHELKTLDKYFNAIRNGDKPFEVRKDDREFEIGDFLVLKEVDGNGDYTGRDITYILGRQENEKQYVQDGYVILGIK